jgi:glutamyl-tRNA synthetase
MHVGTVRTAVFDWLLARSTGGRFILRIEDTDQSRYVEGATEAVIEGLRWLGILPDEGPGLGGSFGPYVQSERLPRYREAVDQLLASGDAYRCFCTADALAERRAAREAAGGSGRYDRRCRERAPAEAEAMAAAGQPHVIRVAMPTEGKITVHDRLRGEIQFDSAELQDAVILKSDGFPTYQLAVVIDDHDMLITHVLRGEEWISSAPIQVRLYAAFGWTEPAWVHVPLVLKPDGKGKLSKRHGGAELLEYRRLGYLPEAMFNFLALLGWRFSGETEIFDREEAIRQFDIDALQVSHARWDIEKLNWMNGQYIRALAPEDLAQRLLPFLNEAGLPASQAEVLGMVPLIQERLVTLSEAPEKLALFWASEVAPEVSEMVPKKHDAADALRMLGAAHAALDGLAEAQWKAEALEGALRDLAEREGWKLGPLLQPLRVATTGSTVAPPMFGTLEIIGRERVLARLLAGMALLESSVTASPA